MLLRPIWFKANTASTSAPKETAAIAPRRAILASRLPDACSSGSRLGSRWALT